METEDDDDTLDLVDFISTIAISQSLEQPPARLTRKERNHLRNKTNQLQRMISESNLSMSGPEFTDSMNISSDHNHISRSEIESANPNSGILELLEETVQVSDERYNQLLEVPIVSVSETDTKSNAIHFPINTLITETVIQEECCTPRTEPRTTWDWSRIDQYEVHTINRTHADWSKQQDGTWEEFSSTADLELSQKKIDMGTSDLLCYALEDEELLVNADPMEEDTS